jgi:hypothetical protein
MRDIPFITIGPPAITTYSDRHHGHHDHHGDHDLLAIIGGAILVNEILDD